MNKTQFLNDFEDILMVEKNTLSNDVILNQIEEWDSLSRIALTAYLEEKFEIKTSEIELRKIETVSDILTIINDRLDSN